MNSQVPTSCGPAVAGSRPCVWGAIALGMGLFVLGIPCGLLAIYLGSAGVKQGATTFGTVVKVGGWAELILTVVRLVA